jgi:hypothetical protein
MTSRPAALAPEAACSTGSFFILGAPRSGTSLLSRMLDAHPAIAVPDETKIFETFAPLLPLYGDLRRPDRLRRLVRDVLAWRWVRRLPDLPGPGDVLARVERRDLGGVFEAFLSTWAARRGRRRCGEKTPSNLYLWPSIERAFPEATVVHILRDGRDVALSQVQAPFGPKTMAGAAERWVGFVDRIRAIGDRAGPARYVEVRYEDLLADPRGTIQGVLRFLGEPFHPDVLRFHRSDRPVGTDPVNDENVLRPLQVGNAGKWRTGASRREVEIFEAIAGGTLEACGYRRATGARPMPATERAARRYLQHPPRKTWAMLRNRPGLEEALERERLRWRLRAEAALDRGGGAPGGWGHSAT